MKRSLFSAFIFIIYINISAVETITPSYSIAGFYEVENSPRQVYSFNLAWRFYKGDVKGAEHISFDDSLWEAANLPHGLEILPENASGGVNYQGIAWYRKEFNFDKKLPGNKVFLYFEAIMGKSKIWVNGTLVAENFGGYLPVMVDISEFLTTSGKKNVIAVMADNSDDNTYLPGKKQSRIDFSYFGGIYRDSYLIETSDVHVSFPEISKTVAGGGIFVATTDLKGNSAEIEIRVEVNNDSKSQKNIIVKTILEDMENNELQSVEQKIKLVGKTSQQLSKQMQVKNAHLWHPDDPYLHFIRTEVYADGKLVDQMRTRFGIRFFEMKGNDGFYLNKQPFKGKLFGANRHQDYTYIGNALPNSGQWRDVKILREGGCKIIRAAHYPLDPAFYDACDQFGMLTTTATPGWHYYNFNDTIFEHRMYDDTRKLVRRDRNRPSILMWEVALNETPEQPEHAVKQTHRITHEEIPFPSVFTASRLQVARKGGFDIYFQPDSTDKNVFVREMGDGGEVDDWTSNNAESRVKMEWGEKALLGQALNQAKYLHGYNTPTDKFLGGAKWAGIDHQRGAHVDPFWGGILDGTRIPKYLYYLYKSQYDADFELPGIETGPMLYIAHELTQISPKDVVVFSNCDKVRLTWLEEDRGIQVPDTGGNFSGLAHAPFIFKNVYNYDDLKGQWRPGMAKTELIAEGIIDGKVVITVKKDYVKQKEGLKLYTDGHQLDLMANGSDIIPVRAVVVDPNGNKKVLASDYVHFTVDGPAEIIGGVNNHGNPVKTEFGVATVLIRATNEPGEITVKAYSNNLESGELSFNSIAPQENQVYSEEYLKDSKQPIVENVFNIKKTGTDLPTNVKDLQKEVEKLQLKIVGQEQEIMELRNRIKE